MESNAIPKGQRVISPEGEGEVIEIIGDKVMVKLDNGETRPFPSGDITDNSSAG